MVDTICCLVFSSGTVTAVLFIRMFQETLTKLWLQNGDAHRSDIVESVPNAMKSNISCFK